MAEERASSRKNRQVLLVSRASGLPGDECFAVADTEIPEISPGQVLVRVKYVSIDPAMRNWMNDAPSYLPPVGLGEVMRAMAAGRVVRSEDPSFKPGDAVTGFLGVQEFAAVDAAELTTIDTTLAPMSRYLGVLGITGLTAYFGLLEVGKPVAGDTVLVSSAAGAVGSTAGQLAKIRGCRSVGIAGGPQKCAIARDAGFDAVVDYKALDFAQALTDACPEGIDIYFDNVGGEMLDLALARLRLHARVVICGAVSQSNLTTRPVGPANYRSLLVNRARMEGFIYFDYHPRFPDAIVEMTRWIESGQLRFREHVVEDMERFPAHLRTLFNGENMGKLMVQLEPDNGHRAPGSTVA